MSDDEEKPVKGLTIGTIRILKETYSTNKKEKKPNDED